MTLSFFRTEIWQEGKSDIQVIKTLRFIADAKVRLHPCKQRRQKSFSTMGQNMKAVSQDYRIIRIIFVLWHLLKEGYVH